MYILNVNINLCLYEGGIDVYGLLIWRVYDVLQESGVGLSGEFSPGMVQLGFSAPWLILTSLKLDTMKMSLTFKVNRVLH